MENQSLHHQVQEYRKKLDSALQLHTQFERNVVDLAKQVDVLQVQVKDLRKSKHQLETELSQEQMTNMNEKLRQQEWTEKEAESKQLIHQLKSEVFKLKHSLEEQQLHEAALLSSMAPLPMVPQAHLAPLRKTHSRNLSNSSTTSSVKTEPGQHRDKTVDRLKGELEMVQQQTEVISREYALRHNQLENKLKHTNSLVDRLREENKGFQAQLAERIILDDNDDDMDQDPESRPLKLIVERLIERLLEFRQFEKMVEVDQDSITAFQQRLANSHRRGSLQRSMGRVSLVRNPATWSTLLFGDADSSVHTVTSTTDATSTPATSLASVLELSRDIHKPHLEGQTKLRPLTMKAESG